MRRTLLVCCLLLPWIGAHAQGTRTTRHSLTFGMSQNDFRYVTGSGVGTYYDFQAPYPLAILTLGESTITLGRGVQSSDPLAGQSAISMTEASIHVGPRIIIGKRKDTALFQVHIPIRFVADYRQLVFNDAPTIDVDRIDLVSAQLGLGLGGRMRTDVLRKPLVMQTSLISYAGVLTDAAQTEEVLINGVRSTEFNARIKWDRIIKNRLGLTAGVVFTSVRWTDHSLESSDELIRSLKDPSIIPKRRGQSIFLVGLSF